MTDLNNTGTFAVTTDGDYNTIPYTRAKSFRLTNFTGKVVGVRKRHRSEIIDDFNDTDFNNWTGDIKYESSELEGSGAGRVFGVAHTKLTEEVVLDGAEVVFTLVTPSPGYSIKLSVYDDPSRIGLSGAGSVTLSESNSHIYTKYNVTIRLRPSESKFDAFIEEPGKDRVVLVENGDGAVGAGQLVNSIVAIEPNKDVVIDPIIYHKKVNNSVEHIGHGGSFTYPCTNNTSEYEVINLGSDVMNYSDNTQTISLSGFYVR